MVRARFDAVLLAGSLGADRHADQFADDGDAGVIVGTRISERCLHHVAATRAKRAPIVSSHQAQPAPRPGGPERPLPGVLEVPEQAIIELLVNALIHRDYFTSASIRLPIFADRIEIICPTT